MVFIDRLFKGIIVSLNDPKVDFKKIWTVKFCTAIDKYHYFRIGPTNKIGAGIKIIEDITSNIILQDKIYGSLRITIKIDTHNIAFEFILFKIIILLPQDIINTNPHDHYKRKREHKFT